MIVVVHRLNKIRDLIKLDTKYGVEVDVRCYGKDLILNHEPHESGDLLKNYLRIFKHKFIIFNIKEAGIEQEVIELAKKYKISKTKYFLLDIEYPFIYKATRILGFKNIAVRYSEAEPIEFILAHKGMVNWVWIDTNSILPLNIAIIQKLYAFKTALVCPERWGRPDDIHNYIKKMKLVGFKPDLVMTSVKHKEKWAQF